MSEKEKDLLKKLSQTVQTLEKDKQNYILGVAEGMAIARETDWKHDNAQAKQA